MQAACDAIGYCQTGQVVGGAEFWKVLFSGQLGVEIMDYNLERFKSAQEYDYNNALREIRNGRKTSHWMWYIFPQVKGLGNSGMADYYGISGIDEARAYLADPVLGQRLVEISEVLMALENKNAAMIFGFPDV